MENNISPNYPEILKIQFDNIQTKLDVKYGLNFFKSFWGQVTGGYNSYYQIRNRNWDINRRYSNGLVTHTEFVDLMGIEGNQSYINIDWNIAKILPKYKEALIAGYMDRDEEPSIKATDILSFKFKEYEKKLAKYRLKNKEIIDKLEKASGQKLENGYIPQDEDDLDIYFKTKWRTPEEAFMEKTIRQIFENNNVFGEFKRQSLIDAVETNLMVSKIEIINSYSKTLSNRIRIRRAKPERTFYNIFENALGQDISIVGESYPITIAEARRKYPKIKEQQWFKIAEQTKQGLKQVDTLVWYDTYLYSYNRPYDDYSFLVLDAEIKVIDKNYYVKTENQHGDTVIVSKKGKPNPTGQQEMKGETIEDIKFNIYCGVWAIDTDIMLDWDIQENMIRPYQNGVDVFFSYTVCYPNANGFYQPSIIERGISNVRAMALYKLKIQQLVSLMEADGVSIDISGLSKISLGQGQTYEPLKLLQIKKQTGQIFWDSSDETGTGLDGQRQPPIQNFPNSGNVAQINTLIQLYNFELQNLNDELGLNNDFLGGSVPAKRGARINDNQIQAANKATEFIYLHYLWYVGMIAQKITYKLWDMMVLESVEYKNLSKISSDLIDTTFDATVQMSSKSDEKAKLEEMIKIALEQRIIKLSEAITLREYTDLKDAILYIEHAENKAAQMQMQKAQNDIKLNAQVQQQSVQINKQGEAYLAQIKAQGDAQIEKVKGDSRAYEEMVKMVKDVYLESIKSGKEIPPSITPIIDAISKNVINQSIIKPQQQEEEAMAQQQQEQQQQQQNQNTQQ